MQFTPTIAVTNTHHFFESRIYDCILLEENGGVVEDGTDVLLLQSLEGFHGIRKVIRHHL